MNVLLLYATCRRHVVRNRLSVTNNVYRDGGVYLYKCIPPNISGKHERLHIRLSHAHPRPQHDSHAHPRPSLTQAHPRPQHKDTDTEKHLPQEQIGLLCAVCISIKNYDAGVSRTRRLEGKGEAGGAHRLARYLQVTHITSSWREKKEGRKRKSLSLQKKKFLMGIYTSTSPLNSV